MSLSLEREMLERELRPRLCYLTKTERGYGFHLHGERGGGAQFVRRVEAGSPAELAGLRSGDRVVEVNGENVEMDSHQQVVEKIMAVEHRTRLLVVDREADEFLRFHGLPCTEELAVEMGCLSPRASSLASSPRTSCSSSPHVSLAPSPRDSITPPFSRGGSERPKAPAVSSASDKLALILNSRKSPSTPPLPLPNVSPIPRFSTTLSPLHPPSPCPSDPEAECNTDFSGSDTSTQEASGREEEQEEEEEGMMKDLRPRLCNIIAGEQGFGFNLHCDKSRVGQYVRSVDPDSPAQRAGLRPGDRLVEVNGRSIVGVRHAEVVALIRARGGQTQLLVVDPETDTLFKRLGITPTTAHLKEDCVDGPLIESPELDSSVSPSPTPEVTPSSPPVISVTLTEPATATNGSLKHQSYASFSSRSTVSEMSVDLSDSDTGTKIFDSGHHKHHSAPGGESGLKGQPAAVDPLWDSGLRLSPTAAEARQRVTAKRGNKRAPPMDWSKKQEIFSNF